ncbi:hypothetical protein [Reichenbachiella versicolor]|uniref:hypothetical protein n=1 Tax=Reichenbachiella versicolor TaxID=1821036 RepID=UPI000D6E1339|nr:hypothetical protein [Reichenbachiella versicolor]
MPHRFSKGLDLILDPTGETPLSDHVFIDGENGNDATTDGTNPNTPYKTINAALTLAQANTTRFIILEGEYFETGWESHQVVFIADGQVVVRGTGTNRLFDTHYYFVCDGITFKDFEYAYRSHTNGSRYPIFTNCKFINAPISGKRGANVLSVTFDNCLFINSEIDLPDATETRNISLLGHKYYVSGDYNCIYINSPLKKNQTHIQSCYFDENSSLEVASSGRTLINNNIRSSITIDDTTYTDLESAIETVSSKFNKCFSEDPLMINPNGMNFNIQRNSPNAFKGLPSTALPFNENIGGSKIIDQTWHQGVSELDIAISNHPNLSINGLGEIVNNSGSDQWLNLPEVDLGGTTYLGTFIKDGFTNPKQIRLFLNWAFADRIYQPDFKEFKWNISPSTDLSGKSNAELEFDRRNFSKVPANYYKVRLLIKG